MNNDRESYEILISNIKGLQKRMHNVIDSQSMDPEHTLNFKRERQDFASQRETFQSHAKDKGEEYMIIGLFDALDFYLERLIDYDRILNNN